MAERVGFEPTVRENRTPDFESGTFDHSATLLDTASAMVEYREAKNYIRVFDDGKPSLHFVEALRKNI